MARYVFKWRSKFDEKKLVVNTVKTVRTNVFEEKYQNYMEKNNIKDAIGIPWANIPKHNYGKIYMLDDSQGSFGNVSESEDEILELNDGSDFSDKESNYETDIPSLERGSSSHLLESSTTFNVAGASQYEETMEGFDPNDHYGIENNEMEQDYGYSELDTKKPSTNKTRDNDINMESKFRMPTIEVRDDLSPTKQNYETWQHSMKWNYRFQQILEEVDTLQKYTALKTLSRYIAPK
jgi:hypothetical protein